MIRVRINHRKYCVPTRWEEITLSQCGWLYTELSNASTELRDYYLSFARGAISTSHADMHEVEKFSGNVMEHLAGIPWTVLSSSERIDLMSLAGAVLPRFVCGVLGYVDHANVGVKYFRCRGWKYHLPKDGTDIMGNLTPLSGLTAEEFCQISDIVISGDLSLAPLALSIVCRRWNEKYYEKRAQRRAGRFAQLPASIYWDLWTRVSCAHDYLRDNYPNVYGSANNAQVEPTVTGPMWCNTLVALAAGHPSELEYLKHMNGYEFVHLVSENIKQKSEEWKMNAALSGSRAGSLF